MALPVMGHNQQGRQIELTYNQVLFLITSPLHRWKVDYFIYIQEGVGYDKIMVVSRMHQKVTCL
jgi:hypothetical protein